MEEEDLGGSSDVEVTFVQSPPRPSQLPNSSDPGPSIQQQHPIRAKFQKDVESRCQTKKEVHSHLPVVLDSDTKQVMVLNQWLTVRKHSRVVQSSAVPPNSTIKLAESVPPPLPPASTSVSVPSPSSLDILEVSKSNSHLSKTTAASISSSTPKIQPVCPSSLRVGASIKGIVIPSPDAVPVISIPSTTTATNPMPISVPTSTTQTQTRQLNSSQCAPMTIGSEPRMIRMPFQSPPEVANFSLQHQSQSSHPQPPPPPPPPPQRFHAPIVIRNQGATQTNQQAGVRSSVIVMPNKLQRPPVQPTTGVHYTAESQKMESRTLGIQNGGKNLESTPTVPISTLSQTEMSPKAEKSPRDTGNGNSEELNKELTMSLERIRSFGEIDIEKRIPIQPTPAENNNTRMPNLIPIDPRHLFPDAPELIHLLSSHSGGGFLSPHPSPNPTATTTSATLTFHRANLSEPSSTFGSEIWENPELGRGEPRTSSYSQQVVQPALVYSGQDPFLKIPSLPPSRVEPPSGHQKRRGRPPASASWSQNTSASTSSNGIQGFPVSGSQFNAPPPLLSTSATLPSFGSSFMQSGPGIGNYFSNIHSSPPMQQYVPTYDAGGINGSYASSSHLNGTSMSAPAPAYQQYFPNQQHQQYQQQAHTSAMSPTFFQNHSNGTYEHQSGEGGRNSTHFSTDGSPSSTSDSKNEPKKRISHRKGSKKVDNPQLECQSGNNSAGPPWKMEQRRVSMEPIWNDVQSSQASTSSFQSTVDAGQTTPKPKRKYERRKKKEELPEVDDQGNLVVKPEKKKGRPPGKKKEEPPPEVDAEGNLIPPKPKRGGRTKKTEELPSEFNPLDVNLAPKKEKRKRAPRKKKSGTEQDFSTLTPQLGLLQVTPLLIGQNGETTESVSTSGATAPTSSREAVGNVPYWTHGRAWRKEYPQIESQEITAVSSLMILNSQFGGDYALDMRKIYEVPPPQNGDHSGNLGPGPRLVYLPLPPQSSTGHPGIGLATSLGGSCAPATHEEIDDNRAHFILTPTAHTEVQRIKEESEKKPSRRGRKAGNTDTHTILQQQQLLRGPGMSFSSADPNPVGEHPGISNRRKSYPAQGRFGNFETYGGGGGYSQSNTASFDNLRARTILPKPEPGLPTVANPFEKLAHHQSLYGRPHSFSNDFSTTSRTSPSGPGFAGVSSDVRINPIQSQTQLGGGSLNGKKSTRRPKSEPKPNTTPKPRRSRKSTKVEVKTEPIHITSPVNPVLSNSFHQEPHPGTSASMLNQHQQRPSLSDELRMSPSVTIQQLKTTEMVNHNLVWTKDIPKVKPNRAWPPSGSNGVDIEGRSTPHNLPMKREVKILLSQHVGSTIFGALPNSDQEMVEVKSVLSFPDLTITKASEEDEQNNQRRSSEEDVVLIQRIMQETSLNCTEEEVEVKSEPKEVEVKSEPKEVEVKSEPKEVRRRGRPIRRVNYDEKALQNTRSHSTGSEQPTGKSFHPVQKIHRNPNPQHRVVENPGFSWTYTEEELSFIFRDGGFLMKRLDLGLDAEKLTIWKIIDKGDPTLTLKAYEPYSKKSSNRWFHVSNLIEKNEKFSETREWGAETLEITRVLRQAFLEYVPVYVDKICHSPEISVVRLYREDRFLQHMVNIYKTEDALKEPFYNLMRGIVYHSMDPTFLSKVVNSTTETTSPEAKLLRAGSAEISTLIQSVCDKFTSCVRWSPRVLERLKKFPKLVYSAKNCDKSRNCDGCAHSVRPLHHPTKAVTFEGLPYDSLDLMPFPEGYPGNDDKPNPDYQFCHSCNNFLKGFHTLYHTRYNILLAIHFRLELLLKEFPDNVKIDTMSVKQAFDADIDWYRWMFLDFLVSLSVVRIHTEQMWRVTYINA